MMKPHGQLFVVLIANSSQIDAHIALSRTPKWATLLSNYHQVLNPYQYSENPDADLVKILEEVGFNCKFSLVKNESEPYAKK